MNALKEALGCGSLNYVPNAFNRARGGYVQICFSPQGTLRLVQKVYRGGRVGDRTTYQAAFEGDYILRRQWYPEVEKLYRVVGEEEVELVPDHQDDGYLMAVVLEAMEKVDDFMAYGGAGGFYIPTGEAWDGVNTVASDRKRDKIVTFWSGLPPKLLSRVLEASRISPSSGMPRNWNDREMLPVRAASFTANDNAYWVYPDPMCDEGSWVAECHKVVLAKAALDTKAKPIHIPTRCAMITFATSPRDQNQETVSWTLYRG